MKRKKLEIFGSCSAGEWETQVVRIPGETGRRWRLERCNGRGQVVERRMSVAVFGESISMFDILDEGDNHRGRIPWRQ